MDPVSTLQLPASTKRLIHQWHHYTVGGSTPLPVFIAETRGSLLWDVDGKEYIDFISMAGAVNQGHAHPKIIAALKQQLDKASLVNHSANNALWPAFSQMMCQRFGYDKIASAVSGTDGVDVACKIARKWAITKKRVPPSDILVLAVSDCFHGLASGVWGLQDRSQKRDEYGINDKHHINYDPSTQSILTYGNLPGMTQCIEKFHRVIAAVIMEPIRALLPTFEAEIEYMQGVYNLCNRFNILFIADEIRMGVCRTGRFLSSDYLADGCKPDMIILGKSITGGAYPASYILGREDVMSVVGPREIVQTFAFSPMAVAATTAVLEIVDDERLAEKALKLSALFLNRAQRCGWELLPCVDFVTARGAELAIWFKTDKKENCQAVALCCMQNGLLMFPKDNYLRMCPTLVMPEEMFERALDILGDALVRYANSLNTRKGASLL